MRFLVKYKLQGKIHTQIFKAPSKKALEEELHKQRYIVLELRQKQSIKDRFYKKPTIKEILNAFYELKLGLKAHLPLQELLENVQKHTKNKALSGQFEKAHYALNSGKTLAQSFKEAGFSDFVCAMLLVGQKTNRLYATLELIILRLKNQQNNQKTLTKVLLYPSLVMLVMVGVFLGITLFVLPQFETLFGGIDAELPFVSWSLLFMRGIVLDYGLLSGIICVTLLIILSNIYKKFLIFKCRIDAMFLKIPFLGKVIYHFEMVQFLLSLFWLYQARIPLQETLEIATKSLHNAHLKQKASKIFSGIERGVEIKEAFSKSGMFEELGQQLLKSAHNEAGFLETLEILLELHKEELETHSQTLLASIEPLMILILGVLVLWLALGIFLPLWELPLQMQGV